MTKTDIEALKKDYIKLIQTLKTSKFPDDDSRYMYMQENFGKTSLRDMSIDELRIMLDFLGGKVWHRYQSKKGCHTSGLAAKDNTREKATKKQITMMGEIWKEVARNKNGLALRNFVARVCKRSAPLYLEYLSKEDASTVIIALRRWKNAKQQ
ncbi:phage protein GemA/Gp16 family protein [Campylobacter fetus]|uniref:phage protein GemA/Gp16 family protein n=1 Tax=Campylobacter fetus TaxID=196 RepID=UPI00138E26BB|nr:phage protein GemA/Gp16 family protein [Campylobacter fetus]